MFSIGCNETLSKAKQAETNKQKGLIITVAKDLQKKHKIVLTVDLDVILLLQRHTIGI